MKEPINLSRDMNRLLPAEALLVIGQASNSAERLGFRVFLVGGVVRDILLGRNGFDLDLAVEGDAIELARALSTDQARVTVHHRFNTARVAFDGYHLDLARTRCENYTRPGALPTVRPGTIEDDLGRRDFTVNAMALSLNRDDYGNLIDRHGGRDDLKAGLIRVLHAASFTDDATRLWRAIRYEQRFGFAIEPHTLDLFRRDIDRIADITPDRQRYELECVLGEARPETIFCRADELGLLNRWHPALSGDEWLKQSCRRLRAIQAATPSAYLSLLCWRLDAEQKASLARTLKLSRRQYRVLQESTVIRDCLSLLDSSQAPPSRIASLLRSLDADVLAAARAALEPARAVENIERYLATWSRITPALNGENLLKLGVPRGPDIGRMLEELRDLTIDGAIDSRQAEEHHVRDWLTRRGLA
jgi:tRNA nucleotidyltransferase (CCA-adding enzyme)